jgi:hypothetical protein
MPYTTNYSVIPNQEIYNYIEDVNYGMSKPQINHHFLIRKIVIKS